MAKSKNKKMAVDKVHKKNDRKMPSRKKILRERAHNIPGKLISIQPSWMTSLTSIMVTDSQKVKDEPHPSPPGGILGLLEEHLGVKGEISQDNEEFPTIDEAVAQEAKCKSQRSKMHDLRRKVRAVELADKDRQKLEKKAVKAATVSKSKSDSQSEVTPIIYGLTPPKTIQALTIAAQPASDEAPCEEPLPVEDHQLLPALDNKEEKRLRRLKRVGKRQDETAIASKPKSLEKLTSLMNRRNERYAGAKFAALLDLAEKILVVDSIPGETIEQKANMVVKEVTDMELQMDEQELEANSNNAIVLRSETPEILPTSPRPSIQERKSLDDQAVVASDGTVCCRWEQCAETFNSLEDLFFHVYEGHITSTPDEDLQKCCWNHCDVTTTTFTQRGHLINHMHSDYCSWLSRRHGPLREHVKKVHPELITSVPAPIPFKQMKANHSNKRKRANSDYTTNEVVPNKPSKKRKLAIGVALTLEEFANPNQQKKKHQQKEPAAKPEEDAADSRPKKRMKSQYIQKKKPRSSHAQTPHSNTNIS